MLILSFWVAADRASPYSLSPTPPPLIEFKHFSAIKSSSAPLDSATSSSRESFGFHAVQSSSPLMEFESFSTGSLLMESKASSLGDSSSLACSTSSLMEFEAFSDDRKWAGDIGSKFLPSGLENISITSKALHPLPSVPQVPYMTARISPTQFTYTFPASPGPKFLRLYFYPASYPGVDDSKALFSVASGGYTLLSNFSPNLVAYALGVPYFTREFSITVGNKKRLKVTFIPSPSTSDSYAFVNGIEPFPFFIEDTTVLETFYRLNVGGDDIFPVDDTGMFRTWSYDSKYLLPSSPGVSFAVSNLDIKFSPTIPDYTAPASVYSTARSMGSDQRANANYNLTWILPIDPGFYYLVRLHFCEIESVVKLKNERVFHIFINNQTADDEADVIGWSGGKGVPVYRDYVVMVSEGAEGSQDLCVELHPSNQSKYYDVILNGVEIFKLTNRDNVLAAPVPPQHNPAHAKQTRDRTKIIIISVSAIGGLIIFFLLGFNAYRIYKRSTSFLEFKKASSGRGRHFSLGDIKAATNNFAEDRIIGVGGFGNVYKGFFDGGSTTVAIKRWNGKSAGQGVEEFEKEVEILSKLRHRNLVSLIGYCKEDREMVLVYDYMSHGDLRGRLFDIDKARLSWVERLRVCIGAGCGLHYLHTGAKPTIIHRDVKTTNILLDEKLEAKVSDFGISKQGPFTFSHVSTEVRGSFGYFDPDYVRTQKLTRKSDVYSFGVVLFEVPCARPATNAMWAGENEERVSLVELVRRKIGKGTLDQIIDPHLRGRIAPESLAKFVEIAEKCLADRGRDRPSMGDVLCHLEQALELQRKENVEQ
ncbi:hypothetical protein HHK36_029900 [Tetracentron sinense]|uniref:Protein kinase domain-containing protein n=1 Tax=Tetracentron sinense TaxID=13715 RepID=A0A834YEQ1_TETSI|nr:hypothetical protein HHK36_029900 [Tetracentron sinense]